MKFRAHETFFIRKGWLYKGLKHVRNNAAVFTDRSINQNDLLGIGTNMVKSLRYWMQAVGLTTEERNGNNRMQFLTSFGELVWENDRYFEEDGTLWYLHYLLSSNKELATTWYWFFNEFRLKEFSKEDFMQSLGGYINYNIENTQVAQGSLEDDLNCLINTYISRKKIHPEKANPENNIDCPLGNLGIVDIADSKRKIYYKVNLKKDQIDPIIVLAVIVDQYNKRCNSTREIQISGLINDECNIGRTFNMDSSVINYYLDKIQELGYLKVIRTAGLDVVRLNDDYNVRDILKEYYYDLNSFESREDNEQE